MIYFSSDHHFGHESILRYTNRPFNSIDEMDEELIRRWNLVVNPEDTIYHLGDFTLKEFSDAAYYFSRLHGNIYVVPGGHDKRWLRKYRDTQTLSASGVYVSVLPPLYSLEIDIGEKRPLVIVLSHFAMRSWDRSHHGSYHLYGHSHGKLESYGLSFDVGVDCWDFYPLSLDQVLEIFKGMEK